ncbi:hypothetical protein CQ020_03810 [Arthrobacter sp. MYb23]|uniref:hypothetical protein n=1 Tax=unclassified Arthrobacter TaxID=235627 RepID=UPI000CFAC530|nr:MULTISPECIES: hypothetical protein [unclassified Arthrobacter]PRB44345.1 hypothetical protein CQ038_03665 [Arthrobacter sp. MYb51]PRB98597.1 hypothetical protein CQ020_03810 [Arthrobacter sp. MYb23]
MAFTSIGYDGTVNESQWAALIPSAGSSEYGVKGAGDLKVTAVPGQPLMVSVAAGTGWGHGVLDTQTTNVTITCDAISSGTRWDLIALRRNWQPLAGGPTAAVKVTGATEKTIPAARKSTPGVEDDQPLALVQWKAGQTQPQEIIDLRCWAGNGGLIAKDSLALSYLTRLGATVTIDKSIWTYAPGANDMPGWVSSSSLESGLINTTSFYTALGAGYEAPGFEKSADGVVISRGAIGVNIAEINMLADNPYTIGTISASAKPRGNKMLIVPTGAAMGGWGRIYIRPDLSVTFETPQAFSRVLRKDFFINLDGFSWVAAA